MTVPNLYDVKCPVCGIELGLWLDDVEVRKVINKSTITDTGGFTNEYVAEEKIEVRITASIRHACTT